ncbi:MAG: hypothetical protein HOY71_53370 [Nonomuraea sp.]|nr:hypothetical protein [Nonomuraea sp.]
MSMYAGLALTVLATIAPLIDLFTTDLLGEHDRAAYPDWGPDLVAADRNAIAIYLIGAGVLGIVCWLVTIAAAGRRWAAIAGTLFFAAGTVLALANLSMGGEKYDVVVPYLFGALTLLPCLAGLAAVVSLWRTRPGR